MADGWTIGAWVAAGVRQPLRTRLGHVHDRALAVTALRAGIDLASTRVVAVRYTVDVVPLVVATRNPEYAVGGTCALADCPRWYLREFESRRTAYAFGLAPIGFEAEWFPRSRIALTTSVSGGGLYFDRRIPDPDATRFNFSADGAAGVRVRAAGTSVSGGVRWYHISNGFTGSVNPTMDSRLFWVGITR